MFDIFSKRAKRQSGEIDVYQYENIPNHTKIQIILLWRRSIGNGGNYSSSQKIYESICSVLREEYGLFHLYPERQWESGLDELSHFFLNEKNIMRCLDVIELAMRATHTMGTDNVSVEPEEAEQILNLRLREAGVGYQYESEEIIKIDHQLVHSEITKPVLLFLADPKFKGANDEFLQAHKNYKIGEYKSCLVEALKAFESTMKIICNLRGWSREGDNASKLITTILKNNLIPAYLQTQFNALKSVLESGIPTVRNKTAAHGQGEEIQEVPEYFAAYVLHQTASAILFLVKAHQAKTH